MSTSAERTYSDAISNATYDLAKAKEALTLALNYFTNCEHYDHVEAMTDITMNGFSTKTDNGRMIATIAAEVCRLQRFTDMAFDYVHRVITTLDEAREEAKADDEPGLINKHAQNCILSRDIRETSQVEKAYLMTLGDDWSKACTCGACKEGAEV